MYLPVKLLSYSAMTMFLECPRRYAFRYIDKAEPEGVLSDALAKGRALHACLEAGNEEPANDIQDTELRVQVRCGARLIRLMREMGHLPPMKRKEVKIINEEHSFIGYLDGECINDDNTWMIGETKTTSSFDQVRFALMRVSAQVGLYVGMIGPYAHENFLSPADFLGVHHTAVVFPKLQLLKANKRRKTEETEQEYEARVNEKTKVYQQLLGTHDLAVAEAMKTFSWVKEMIDHIGPRSDNYPKCTAQCKNQFGLCDYFEQCHGFNVDLGASVLSDIDTEELP